MSDEDMDALLAAVERQLGESWRDVVEVLRDNNSLDDIAERIHNGDIDGAVQGVEDAAKDFADAQLEAYTDSAEKAAKWLDGETDSSITVRFDETNHRAVKWAERNEMDLVREMTKEQKELLARIHRDGVAEGLNPRDIAREMRDSIGLTDYQAQIVQNYRRALEAGDWSNALGRELTDGRDDRSVAALVDSDKELSASRIDSMVERYRQNWIDHRAEMIARTEGLRVAHQGTRELFQQAIDNGDVEADELERTWHHHNAKGSRETHEEMDGQKRGIDEPFESGSGALLMFPGDPDADPEETIGCKCAVSTRIVRSKRAAA